MSTRRGGHSLHKNIPFLDAMQPTLRPSQKDVTAMLMKRTPAPHAPAEPTSEEREKMDLAFNRATRP